MVIEIAEFYLYRSMSQVVNPETSKLQSFNSESFENLMNWEISRSIDLCLPGLQQTQYTGITMKSVWLTGWHKIGLPSQFTLPGVSNTWRRKSLSNRALEGYHVPFEKKKKSWIDSDQNSVLSFFESRGWNPKPIQSDYLFGNQSQSVNLVLFLITYIICMYT